MLKILYGTDDWNYGLVTHYSFLLLGDPSLNVLPTYSPPIYNYEETLIDNNTENVMSQSNSNSLKPSVEIYPNPADDILNVCFYSNQKDEGTISIYDLSGRLIYDEKTHISKGTESKNINLENLCISNGIYIIRINTTGIKEIKRFVYISN